MPRPSHNRRRSAHPVEQITRENESYRVLFAYSAVHHQAVRKGGHWFDLEGQYLGSSGEILTIDIACGAMHPRGVPQESGGARANEPAAWRCDSTHRLALGGGASLRRRT